METKNQLARAVSDVMEKVERIKKGDDNKFAGYRFTSVDDYKDVLRPLMAEKGLAVGMSETKFEMFTHTKDKKDSAHCRLHFEIWLEHSSGEKGDREGTTVCLPYAMAQTTGQARSYALKEWLKSKFLASSGDLAEDADAQNYDIKFSKAEGRKIYDNLNQELGEFTTSGTHEELLNWAGKNKILLDAMPNDWTVFLRNEYKQAEVAIRMRERGEEPDPIDYNTWIEDFDNQLGVTNTEDEVNEVWVEHEIAIGDMPSATKATAKRVYGKHLERVTAG